MLVQSYGWHLKRYDKDLFVGKTMDGLACVFRKAKRFEPVIETEDFKLSTLVEDKQFVLALTDNWTARGKPRQWGIDRVMDKIREMDVLANERLFEEMDLSNEKVDESNKRAMKNDIESFCIENRRAFAKATDDILTHSLSKDEPKRRLKDRRIKNGNS